MHSTSVKFRRSFAHAATAAVGKRTTIRLAGLLHLQAAITITLLSNGCCMNAQTLKLNAGLLVDLNSLNKAVDISRSS